MTAELIRELNTYTFKVWVRSYLLDLPSLLSLIGERLSAEGDSFEVLIPDESGGAWLAVTRQDISKQWAVLSVLSEFQTLPKVSIKLDSCSGLFMSSSGDTESALSHDSLIGKVEGLIYHLARYKLPASELDELCAMAMKYDPLDHPVGDDSHGVYMRMVKTLTAELLADRK